DGRHAGHDDDAELRAGPRRAGPLRADRVRAPRQPHRGLPGRHAHPAADPQRCGLARGAAELTATALSRAVEARGGDEPAPTFIAVGRAAGTARPALPVAVFAEDLSLLIRSPRRLRIERGILVVLS